MIRQQNNDLHLIKVITLLLSKGLSSSLVQDTNF